MAWVIAFHDYRLQINLTTVSVPLAPDWPERPPVLLAPDGRSWWDGHKWRDGWADAPHDALRSPDGRQWFTGQHWVGPDSGPAGGREVITLTALPNHELPDEPEWWRRLGRRHCD